MARSPGSMPAFSNPFSKRLSELIVQAYAEKVKVEKLKICFAMVRFGNVLNSSGSVVPLFKEQILNGGPK